MEEEGFEEEGSEEEEQWIATLMFRVVMCAWVSASRQSLSSRRVTRFKYRGSSDARRASDKRAGAQALRSSNIQFRRGTGHSYFVVACSTVLSQIYKNRYTLRTVSTACAYCDSSSPSIE